MRTKKGIVTGDKMDKTRVVTVYSYKMNEKYKKRSRISKKYYAHDEKNSTKAGDEITIYETRPLSKLKRWTVEKPEATTAKPEKKVAKAK